MIGNQERTRKIVGLALALALLVGAVFVVPRPRVAAQDRPVSAFQSQAASRESMRPERLGPASFSSEREAIEYFVAKEAARRQAMGPASFSSEREAIEYFVAVEAARRQAAGQVRFASQRDAIEYFVALEAASRMRKGPASFSSEREAIEYFVALQAASRSRSGHWATICSYAPQTLGANPRPDYLRVHQAC